MGGGTQVRIACVGDSITYGAFLLHRKRDCYPAQLQRLLGDAAVVGNFGMIGHTLQGSGDFPYRISKPFRASREFAPDIVLIMLGTNDSKAKNWKGPSAFTEDYRALLRDYRELPSAPRIFVITLPAVYGRGRSGKVKHGMDATAIDEMCRAVRNLAEDDELGLIDAHDATSEHPEAFGFDGVHPGATGHTLIAQAAYEAVASQLP